MDHDAMHPQYYQVIAAAVSPSTSPSTQLASHPPARRASYLPPCFLFSSRFPIHVQLSHSLFRSLFTRSPDPLPSHLGWPFPSITRHCRPSPAHTMAYPTHAQKPHRCTYVCMDSTLHIHECLAYS